MDRLILTKHAIRSITSKRLFEGLAYKDAIQIDIDPLRPGDEVETFYLRVTEITRSPPGAEKLLHFCGFIGASRNDVIGVTLDLLDPEHTQVVAGYIIPSQNRGFVEPGDEGNRPLMGRKRFLVCPLNGNGPTSQVFARSEREAADLANFTEGKIVPTMPEMVAYWIGRSHPDAEEKTRVVLVCVDDLPQFNDIPLNIRLL